MHARPSIVLLSTGVLAASGLAGCGRVDQSEKPNGSRPPATLQLSAAITNRSVNISPSEIGAGPVRIVITNQSSKSVRATLAPAAAGGSRTTRDTIPPGGVAAIQGTVGAGSWRLQVGQGIDSARLKVGRERKSSDGELLLP
ncbi:hypothetical protein [Patulibacter sp.]|uniref:hypothetical protein n=1 Tax=Patulibacter sp. TaxID=1912859 RepID=UPI00271FC195|nr:hypothetical protein [Patulibacter sp.]MDO9407002.1 hypothetical protein [Patulibacter sp.]